MNNIASSIWSRLERHPWLTMVVAVLAQTWFTLGNRALWFSDEVRYANAYQNLALHGKWMVLSLNGQPYPDKPPVYFWFLWLLDKLTPLHMPQVFFLGAALSGLFFLFAAYGLARSLKLDRTVSLAGVLVLLSTFFLAALFHYSRMDLMFAGLIVLSHACFFKAVTGERQGRWPLWAFLLAGVATLVKGPLGFIFPLLTTFLFLLWRGELKKFITRQMGAGLLAMLVILAAWIAGVVLTEGPGFLLHTVLGHQIIERATHTFHHRESVWYYFIAFPLAWLPWTLAIFAVPLRPLVSIKQWGRRWTGRKQAGAATFLWIMFAATFIFLSSLSGKVLIYILPMFPPLALLTAKGLLGLSEKRSTRMWTMVGGLWLLMGAGLLICGDLIPLPVPVHGMGISACLLLAGGAALIYQRTRGARAGLLTAALALIIWLYPVGLLVAPSLDNAMSPKHQGLIIRDYAAKGYTPLAGKIYSGIYTYYAGTNLLETDHLDKLQKLIADHPKVILAIRERHWKEWEKDLPGFTIIDRQSIAGLVHLLLIKG